jgi:hypothetical protein
MLEDKPVPCPFCEGTRLTICETDFEDRKAYAVTCCTIGCHGGIWALGHGRFESREQAVTAWNMRGAQSTAKRSVIELEDWSEDGCWEFAVWRGEDHIVTGHRPTRDEAYRAGVDYLERAIANGR